MATLTELVDAIAEAEGMDSATVALIARYAREAGFIQKKGRGPSAARMSVVDAANLLIAVNASRSALEAPDVIPVYRDLITADDSPPQIRGTFGDALELIIQSAVEGELPKAFLSKNVPIAIRAAFQQGTASIPIDFSRPKPRGLIQIIASSPTGSGMGNPRTHLAFFFFPRSRQPSGELLKLKSGDRTDETKIGSRTIFAVARTLLSSPQYARKGE